MKEKFDKASSAFAHNFKLLDEYERIAEAEPKDVKPGQPDVTDATTASFLETRPKAIVQKNPTGKIKLHRRTKSDAEERGSEENFVEIEEILAELVDNVILPNANTNKAVIDKAIDVIRKGMMYGSQPVLCFMRNEDGYFGADFQLVNIRDVCFEPGKTNARDCNYMFLTAYYTEGDIDAIISGEKELAQDMDYKPEWDLRKLNALKSQSSGKDENSLGFGEEREEKASFIKIVHAFQKGIGGKFFSFDPESGEILRQWANPDPRGIIPLRYFYYDQDGKKPLGKSAIRLTVRLQNMLDKHFQNYQFEVGLRSAPIVKIRGGVDPETVQFEPYAVWDMADDPNNNAEIVHMDNAVINTFPQTQGILKSNILNITNNGDTSISAEVGNPGFSKTPAGVRMQQSRVDINDNYLRRRFEEWFGDVLETMLNIHIAEHIRFEENDIVPLSKRFIETKRRENPAYDKTTDEVDYQKLKGVLAKFSVDAASSKINDDQQQLESLNQLLELRIQAGEAIEPYLKLAPLVRQIVKKSGVPDIEEISPRYDEENEMLNTSMAKQEIVDNNLKELPVEPNEASVVPEIVQQIQAIMAQVSQNSQKISAMEQTMLEASNRNSFAKQTEPLPGAMAPGEEEIMTLLRENGLNPEESAQVIERLKKGEDPRLIDEILRRQK